MKDRKHPIVRKVEVIWENKADIPKKEYGKRQIYAITWNGSVIGIGETSNMKERIPNGYRWKIQSDLFDGSTVIDAMKMLADEQGRDKVFVFGARFLEQVFHDQARLAEKKWINHFRSLGEPILNRT